MPKRVLIIGAGPAAPLAPPFANVCRPFYVTINDVLGADQHGHPFEPDVMTLFSAWARINGWSAIARGAINETSRSGHPSRFAIRSRRRRVRRWRTGRRSKARERRRGR
jgi:hypothetical protein